MDQNVKTTRQPVVNSLAAAVIASICDEVHDVLTPDGRVIIPYEDELLHVIRDDGTIVHNPQYPDPTCPCHLEQEDTSQHAEAMNEYAADFFSVTTEGNNTGGSSLQRQMTAYIMDRIREVGGTL